MRNLVEAEGAAITQARNSGVLKASWTSSDAQLDPKAKRKSPTRVYVGVNGVMTELAQLRPGRVTP